MARFEVNCLYQCRNAANGGQQSLDLGQKWATSCQVKKIGGSGGRLDVLRAREIPALLAR